MHSRPDLRPRSSPPKTWGLRARSRAQQPPREKGALGDPRLVHPTRLHGLSWHPDPGLVRPCAALRSAYRPGVGGCGERVCANLPRSGTHPTPPTEPPAPRPLRNPQHRPSSPAPRPLPGLRPPPPPASAPRSRALTPSPKPGDEEPRRRRRQQGPPHPGPPVWKFFWTAGRGASGATQCGAGQRAPGAELGGAGGWKARSRSPEGRREGGREGREWRHIAGRSGRGGAEKGADHPATRRPAERPGHRPHVRGPRAWRSWRPAFPRKAERDVRGGTNINEKLREAGPAFTLWILCGLV